ncbi:MAG: DUF4445 domain-containing protein [Lachnospiraceae bacterium]|nr:DUF4445 domain-containing protein [Lachnospiraceae bacterium]
MAEPRKGRENRIGTRCEICIGCGRCLVDETTQKKMRVVMTEPVTAAIPFVYTEETRGMRLVTADIGTTTIAMQLYAVNGRVAEEYSCVNPQVQYGADVLSRIQAAREADSTTSDAVQGSHKSAAVSMRNMVLGKLEEGLKKFKETLCAEETLFMVLAGNTTMIYLLMGFDPDELGHAPFSASHLEAQATEIAGVKTYIFPGLSAFVGGDIMAGMYACRLKERPEITLLIDLGTNGEMVLGNRERQIACATAAGPAFEGGVNRGIWGADMIHLLAGLRRENLMDESGLLADPYFDSGILIGDVHVTQESIRAVQLAKGAIGAGIRILLKEYGLVQGDLDREEADDYAGIDKVILAGGFGYYLQPVDAAYIGLLPKGLADKTVSGGNTALTGALRLGRTILEDGGWNAGKMKALLEPEETRVLNLAEHPDFEALYLKHMEFV